MPGQSGNKPLSSVSVDGPEPPSIREVRPMLVRRLVVVGAVAGLLATTLLAGPALAGDQEFGSLSCAAGKVVWITERTSAGTTAVTSNAGTHKILKQAWSTTKTRTGLRATQWRVTTTGLMDHAVTRASCDI
jgi:hypothetical protein